MPIRLKQNGQWTIPRAMPVKVAGAIKLTQMGWVKVADAWRPFFEAFKAIKLTARCTGAATSNSYYYELISNQQLAIQAGDKLIYEIQPHGPAMATGLDGAVSQNGNFVNNLRDFKNPSTNKFVVDQSGGSIHPGNSNSYTPGVWKYRSFDLTPVVGYTLGSWALAFEGDQPGDYTTFIRDVKIVDANGNVRLSIFDKTLNVSAVTVWGNGGNTNYTNIAKIVDTSPL